MPQDPRFEELVHSEFALRADSIYRRGWVMLMGNEIPVSNPDTGGSQNEIADNLFQTFVNIHDFMSLDSSQHNKDVKGIKYNTRHLKDSRTIRGLFEAFVNICYDDQGNICVSAKDAPEIFQHFYEEMRNRSNVPLYGTEMALGALFVEMGRGEKWNKRLPNGIDFTRGEPTPDLHQRFQDAFGGINHSPETSLFIPFPEHTIEIAGVKFPVKEKVNGWQTHFILENGYLCNSTDEFRGALEDHILAGKPIGEFKIPVNEHMYHLSEFHDPIENPQTPAEHMREQVHSHLKAMATATTLEGAPINLKEGVPLMCMDVDLLTGLRITSELKQLKEFMKKTGVADFVDLIPADFTTNIAALSEAEKALKRAELKRLITDNIHHLKELAGEGTPEAALLARAEPHLHIMLPRLYEISDKAFINDDGSLKEAPTASAPQLYMSQGGTGSGKSSLTKIARRECGDSLVTASLDDVRSECDRLWLYLATNNHSDDYKAIEQFGNMARDLTARRAKAGGYNLFIDGSGIPYEGRNDKITRAFKEDEHKYHVSVLAAQAPFFDYHPEERQRLSEQGMLPGDVTSRIGVRLDEQLRTVPMDVTIEKHVGFPLAAANAARDPNVDRFLMQDVSGAIGKDYTLSYVITLSEKELENIPVQGKKLEAVLHERNESESERAKGKYIPDWVTLPTSSETHEPLYHLKVIRKNERGTNGEKTYRVEVITDLEHYLAMTQKGLLRRDAKGPEALYDNTVHCDIEGHFQGAGGKLDIRQAACVSTRPWTPYTPMCARYFPANETSPHPGRH